MHCAAGRSGLESGILQHNPTLDLLQVGVGLRGLGLVEWEVQYLFSEGCTASGTPWKGPGRLYWSPGPCMACRDIWAGFFFNAIIFIVFDVGVIGGSGVCGCDCGRHVWLALAR